jgi:hypothetical protein
MAFEKKTQDALGWIPSWVMDVWIAAILIGFLLIRVLGSGAGQRLLNHLGLGSRHH